MMYPNCKRLGIILKKICVTIEKRALKRFNKAYINISICHLNLRSDEIIIIPFQDVIYRSCHLSFNERFLNVCDKIIFS